MAPEAPPIGESRWRLPAAVGGVLYATIGMILCAAVMSGLYFAFFNPKGVDPGKRGDRLAAAFGVLEPLAQARDRSAGRGANPAERGRCAAADLVGLFLQRLEEDRNHHVCPTPEVPESFNGAFSLCGRMLAVAGDVEQQRDGLVRHRVEFLREVVRAQ